MLPHTTKKTISYKILLQCTIVWICQFSRSVKQNGKLFNQFHERLRISLFCNFTIWRIFLLKTFFGIKNPLSLLFFWHQEFFVYIFVCKFLFFSSFFCSGNIKNWWYKPENANSVGEMLWCVLFRSYTWKK